jgi:hypothetical protein
MTSFFPSGLIFEPPGAHAPARFFLAAFAPLRESISSAPRAPVILHHKTSKTFFSHRINTLPAPAKPFRTPALYPDLGSNLMNTDNSTIPPVTGKEISAHNATRHGCCALDVLILPSENIADFKAIEANWFKTLSPQDETETGLIDQLVSADWLFRRSARTLAEIEAQIFAAEPNPLKWDDAQHKAITRFERYRTANQNAFGRCRKAIEDHRKNRAAEQRKNTAEQQKEERQNIIKERFKIYERKNKPKPTYDEALELMKEDAIRLGYRQR